MYHVEKFSKAGAPLKGQVYVRLNSDVARKERACLETLRGIPVLWMASRNESNYAGEIFEMILQEVLFSREARVDFRRGHDSVWRNCCKPHVVRKLVVNGLS